MPDQRQHSRPRGFTLIELLVAVTLLSVVMAAVYSAFSSTILLWKRGDTNAETYQDARLALGIMTRELQNVVTGSELLFSGSKDTVTFYAAVRPMNVDERDHTRIERITYRLKQDTARRSWTLVREEAPVEGTLPVDRAGTGALNSDALRIGDDHQFEMASAVRGLTLTYLWLQPVKTNTAVPGTIQPLPVLVEREENPTGSGLPQGVRITVTFSDATAPDGQTSFTAVVAFSTETTALDEDGEPVRKGAP